MPILIDFHEEDLERGGGEERRREGEGLFDVLSSFTN